MPVQIKLTNKDCLWLEEVIEGTPSAAQELVSQQMPEGAGYVYTRVSLGSWRLKSVILSSQAKALSFGSGSRWHRVEGGQQSWQKRALPGAPIYLAPSRLHRKESRRCQP